jgi:hypothetical protein
MLSQKSAATRAAAHVSPLPLHPRTLFPPPPSPLVVAGGLAGGDKHRI